MSYSTIKTNSFCTAFTIIHVGPQTVIFRSYRKYSLVSFVENFVLCFSLLIYHPIFANKPFSYVLRYRGTQIKKVNDNRSELILNFYNGLRLMFDCCSGSHFVNWCLHSRLENQTTIIIDCNLLPPLSLLQKKNEKYCIPVLL